MKTKKKTILIVEDDRAQLWVIKKALQRESYNVLAARNGKDGLSLALKKHPDMILLDIVMPKMDGITVLKKLRENKWGKQVPIIFLTNCNYLDTKDDIKQNYEDYLIKSDWSIEAMVKKVKKVLN
ncbi:response regulator [Patescibacteria group bacterium]|nr:response regulator [Patescibacteria group bacterium]MBU0963727.1 response regulator [Patescibacteria group bacterium]